MKQYDWFKGVFSFDKLYKIPIIKKENYAVICNNQSSD
jgi:hypothetical protein